MISAWGGANLDGGKMEPSYWTMTLCGEGGGATGKWSLPIGYVLGTCYYYFRRTLKQKTHTLTPVRRPEVRDRIKRSNSENLITTIQGEQDISILKEDI
ncbi:hypothetical protein TNCT_590771 [Trichonephila clavata]|uniref:Uncharacterized protein n=1 Tax=Trichonephila clavata TaxID=2740835 RepID=A0A8X6K9R0_TRICU|nr:hypothetical protein TNCT_590771 [Trichonephila clavata]